MSATEHDGATDWAKFFEDFEDYHIDARYYENRQPFTVEQLYQAFKARMKFEQDMGY